MLKLKCLEWSNLNRKAQNMKKKNKKKNKPANHIDNNQQQNPQQQAPINNNSIYCLELTGNSDNTRLGCLGSNQIVSVYDQINLKLVNEIRVAKATNAMGFFKKSKHMLFSCANQGILSCWDTRESLAGGKVSVEFEPVASPVRDLLCADVNASDQLIAAGTSKNVDDALLLIYDLRSPQRPLHKLHESHSDDISQVKFNPDCASKFSSAGLDGLVGFYDLESKPEEPTRNSSSSDSESSGKSDEDNDDDDDDQSEPDPDIMDQCLNTESCVSKIGYLRSSVNSQVDRLYAITTTNDFFLWNLDTYDTIYEKKSNKNHDSNDDEDVAENASYFFDCFYLTRDRPIMCEASKSGSIKLFFKDSLVYEQQEESTNTHDDDEDGDKVTSDRRHRDVVRGSYWNANDNCLFTAGEDGFVLKWKLVDQRDTANDSSIKTKKIKNKKRRQSEEDGENMMEEEDNHSSNKFSKKPDFSNKKRNFN